MSDQDLIDTLLKCQEADDLDFKSEQYRLDNNQRKSQFIKDIVAMANTPRAGPAYIVIGVAEKAGKITDVPGVNEHPDEAELGRLVSSKVNPAPIFNYRRILYNGIELGVIEIPCGQPVPIIPRVNYKILHRGCVYIRRNTENTEADANEISRISQWQQGPIESIHNEGVQNGNWEHFYRACDAFDPRRVYIAVLDEEQSIDARDWIAIANIQWNIIVDFDRDTDTNGNHAMARESFSKRRALRISALDDSPTVSSRSTLWMAAAGLNSRPTTDPSDDWRGWNRSKVPQLEQTMRELAKITEPEPVTLVVFGGETKYVSTICEIVDRSFSDRAEYVFANPNTNSYQTTVNQFEASAVTISFPDVCQGIRELQRNPGSVEEIQFPKFGGGTVAMEPERARWVEEQLELVHLDVVYSIEDDQEEDEFLKGGTISWNDLDNQIDAERKITRGLDRQIHNELDLRATRRVNLWHWPGAGATTVARRIAWNLHRKFPTVVAREVQPQETAERLRHLFGITRLPILMVIDLPGITKDLGDRLYDTLRSSHIPVVLFNVERRFDTLSDSANYLDSALTTSEAVRLSRILATHVPEQRRALDALIGETDRRKRIPFYFGLVAYGRDFQGLESYVETRLSQVATPVRKSILYMAFAYYYGQLPLSLQIFASLFDFSASKLISRSRVIPDYIYELLIEDDCKLRPSHQLVAEEILLQELGRESGDRRNWRNGLSDVAIQFIDLLADLPHQNRGGLSEILRAVLIERGSSGSPAGPLESQFSRFLDDVPNVDGRQRVLEHLTNMFPEESHFWAHLGRFYSQSVKAHSKAHEAHQMALRLSPNDSLLHHMTGMGWRAEIYDLLASIGGDLSRDEENEIIRLLHEAAQKFDRARALDRHSEYSYISHVQMIIRVIVGIGNAKGYQHETMRFLTLPGNDPYRELIDQAQNLLSDLSLIKGDESFSQYQVHLRADLEKLHGRHSRAIEHLTNVLDRSDAYHPPVRRAIIRTYIARRGGDWTRLTDRELIRVVELATDNIEEEPTRDHNLRLWFRAVRTQNALGVDYVAERLAYKRLQNPSVETTYYLYIINFLQLQSGDLAVAHDLPSIIKECSNLAQNFSRTTTSFEWLGKETGLAALVHVSTLGKWNEEQRFWSNAQHLKAVRGRIAEIHNQGSGQIELPSGLRVFFVPSRGAVSGGYIPGQDIGREVEFFLGFSYDGLRAWSVHDPEPDE